MEEHVGEVVRFTRHTGDDSYDEHGVLLAVDMRGQTRGLVWIPDTEPPELVWQALGRLPPRKEE